MNKSNRQPWKTNVEGFLFALPWIIGFLIFSVYPIFMSGYYSFTDFSAIKDPVFVGLENYKSLFKDPLFYKSMTDICVIFSNCRNISCLNNCFYVK